MIRLLLLAGVALLATSCFGGSSAAPRPSAVLVLRYTPGYGLMTGNTPVPATQTKRLRCATPMTALCWAAVLVGRHRTGPRTCVGMTTQPADMVVDGTLHGRWVHIDLRGCRTGFPPRMQRAVTRLYAAFDKRFQPAGSDASPLTG